MTGDELKRRREKLGLLPRELAKELQIARSTVVLWEGGRMPVYPPTQEHLERILRKLEKSKRFKA